MPMFSQRGSSSKLMLGVVAATSIAGGGIVQQQEYQQKEPMRRAVATQTDVEKLNAALNSYYLENRSWPTSVNQLVSGGYYTGDTESPYGSQYVIEILPSGNAQIKFDTNTTRDRSFALSKIRGSQEVNGGVQLEVVKPAREAVQSNFLHRVAVAGRPELNRMETDIDMDSNSINNVKNLNAETANIKTLTTDTANATTLNVLEKIDFGSGGSLATAGSGLLFTSDNVAYTNDVGVGNNLVVGNELSVAGTSTITGNMAVNGNIGMSGGTISGFSNIQGGSMTLSGALVTNSITTNNFSADSVTANNFNVTNRLDAVTAVFNDVTSVTFDVNNLNVSGNFTFGNLTVTNTLNSTTTANFNNATTNNLNSSISSLGVANASSMSVSGDITADSITVNNWTSTTHNTTNLNATTASFDTANIIDLSGENAVFNTVNASRVETTFLLANAAEIGDLTVTGNMSVAGTLSSNNVNVSGTTTTNSLTANAGNITNLTSTTATFNSVTANSFVGGEFRGTDFVTGTASVNSNFGLIQNYINQWNSCVAADGCQ